MRPTHAMLKVKRGSLTISASLSNEMTYHCTTEFSPEYRGDTVVFDLERLPGPVHLVVALPDNLQSLHAQASRGSIEVTGLSVQTADINTGMGNCHLKQVQGTWEVNVGKGNLEISHASAEFDLNVGMGECLLSHVSGRADINAGLGPVMGNHCVGEYDIDAGKGNVQWHWGRGVVAIDAGLGDVNVTEAKVQHLAINAGLGKIAVEGGQVNKAELEVGIGSIHLHTRVDHLSAIVRNHGGIDISIPYDSGSRIEASTNHGRIISRLSLIPVGHSGPQRGERLVGVVGDAKGSLFAETRRGTITLSQHADTKPSDGSLDGGSESQSESFAHEDPRMHILRQLQEGSLTVAEADRLLTTLDEGQKP